MKSKNKKEAKKAVPATVPATTVTSTEQAPVVTSAIADTPVVSVAATVAATDPATGVPATAEPSTEQAPVLNIFEPSADPATGVPATGVPATGVPATGVPATGVPATEQPALTLEQQLPVRDTRLQESAWTMLDEHINASGGFETTEALTIDNVGIIIRTTTRYFHEGTVIVCACSENSVLVPNGRVREKTDTDGTPTGYQLINLR